METISVRKLTHANLHIDCDYAIAAELKEFFSFFMTPQNESTWNFIYAREGQNTCSVIATVKVLI